MPEPRQADPVSGPSDLHVRALHVRAVRKDAREVDFVCSTDAVDSYGEIVDQSWKLERYAGNPVVLYAHQSRELPIGTAKNVRVENGQLQATIVFSKAHQRAREVWDLVEEQTLRAVSVGFFPATVRYEKRNGKDVYVLADNELVEISVCPIPANPEALAKARAKALEAAKATPDSPPAERGGDTNHNTEKSEMDEITKAKAALDEANRALEAEKAKAKALETQNGKLVEERDAALARATKAERSVVEQKVDALIGVKFSKDEREDQIELALANPKLFERLTAQRASQPAARDLAGKASVVGDDPTPPEERGADGDNGASLEAEVQKALKA